MPSRCFRRNATRQSSVAINSRCFPYGVGIGKTEGMILANTYQSTIILKHLRILLEVVPVELVYAVSDAKLLCTPFLSRNISSPANMKGTPCDVKTAV